MKDIRHMPARFFRSTARVIAFVGGGLFNLSAALFVAIGVALVAGGLFYYFTPLMTNSDATPTLAPTQSGPMATYNLPSFVIVPPSGSSTLSGSMTPSNSPDLVAIATRIVIPALSIDLPIVASKPNETLPLCNAAEYLVLDKALAYPGAPQATYLYAHARKGMFGPLLTASQTKNGAAMKGMSVEVYTADSQNHVYVITEVLRHVLGAAALARPANATTDQLWLQTSEGPYASSTKLQIVAEPTDVISASYADSHPTRKGNVCAVA